MTDWPKVATWCVLAVMIAIFWIGLVTVVGWFW